MNTFLHYLPLLGVLALMVLCAFVYLFALTAPERERRRNFESHIHLLNQFKCARCGLPLYEFEQYSCDLIRHTSVPK